MAVYLSPGVFPTEIDLSVLPTASGPLRPAFIGTANKGPMNQAVFISTAAQAIATFGEPFPESYLMYAVLTYMAEGDTCYIMRVGIECQHGQDAALDAICVDTTGARGQGWGRIPLFTGIDFGRINLRLLDDTTPYNFHPASTANYDYNDVNVSQTDGPTDASIAVGGSYTGVVQDTFVMVITGAPTGSDPVTGATFQMVRNSDGNTAASGTLTAGQAVDLGNGLHVTINVTNGRLDVNDTFLFEATPDNRKFSITVEGQTSQLFSMPTASYATVADFVQAFNTLVGNNTGFLAVQSTQANGSVLPQIRTDNAGNRIQIGGLDGNGNPDETPAWALEVGQQMYSWDIPRSYLLGLDSGPYTITTNNNRVSLNVIGQSNTQNITFNVPIGTDQSPVSLAAAINSAGVVNGQRYFESYALSLPDGTDHVVISTPLNGGGVDHSLDTLFLQSTYSNLKTLRFAEELDILFPYTRSYRGYTDSRLTLPDSGESDVAVPLSCEADPTSDQCASDSAYFQNVVGFLVATSPGTWLAGYTVSLGVATQVVGDSSGRYNLAINDQNGVQVEVIQDISFDQRADRYIGKVVNPGTPYGGTNGDLIINYEARPAFLNNDPHSSDPSNPYTVRQPSPFDSVLFHGMANGVPLDPSYSSALDAAVIGNQAESTGIFAFENPEAIDINLLAIPGFSSGAVIGQALQLCERRGDVLFLVDPPFGLRPQQVVDWHNGMLLSDLQSAINSSYGALYWGWLKIFDQFNQIDIWVPPSGHVAGVYSRTARVAEQWFAPAGIQRGQLLTALAVEYSPTQGERDLLYGSGNAVNAIVNFPKDGIVVWGQRTLQRTQSALDRVNVRMLLIYIKKNLIPLLRQYVFEPNDSTLWLQVSSAVGPFLADIQARRGLSGYVVICDATNNTPDRIDQNILTVTVFLKPTRTVEFIALNLVTLQTAASFSSEEVLAAGGIVTS